MMGWKYKAGLGLIGTVVFIWVASAEITQRIFSEYKQPFALTYLGVSLMVVYLPIAVLKDWICSRLDINSFKNLCNGSTIAKSSAGLAIPLRINEICPSSETDTEGSLNTDMDLSENEDGWLIITNMEDEVGLLEKNHELSSWEIAKCGFYLAPIWGPGKKSLIPFGFNFYFYPWKPSLMAGLSNGVYPYSSNSALANTSVASTTVLTSTSGLFTLFFGALLGQDTVNITKVVAVFISMAGVAMTTVGKTWAPDEMLSASESRKHSIIGDIFGLLSAVSYGLFTVLLKRSAGSEGDKADVQKFFGYIGLFTLLGFWWLGSYWMFQKGQMRTLEDFSQDVLSPSMADLA
ncbi:Solute carrier family 35 member F5 [Vitis vinifera]|uniref:Solute carrier family 35 member F5 n=1 Tax=Vitis vinifera TaxID=29760 RepID=A0A438F292_VITVI|nr:Solute carrier family 35 member F5 [Vitis vinifera]